MTPELVIFDCDGVLVDTEVATSVALAENLSRHGLPMTAQETFSLFTGGTMKSVGELAKAMGAELPDDWLPKVYDEIFAKLREGIDVIDGVMSLLTSLDNAGIKTAVASNGPMRKMEISLGPSGLFDHFAGRIFSAHDHDTAKPEPGLLLIAARNAGVDPSAAIMIDDNPAGVLAANAAGMPCIGFAPDGRIERLTKDGAIPALSMAEVGRLLRLPTF